VLCLIFEKSFQYFPGEVFLISSLESWIHLLLNLWNQLLLNLESSWFLVMNLEINLDLELVELILKSFFLAFCHHQNYLIHTWIIIMKLASTISPFMRMTTLKSRNTYTFFFLVDHSLNSPYSPPLFLSLSFTWN